MKHTLIYLTFITLSNIACSPGFNLKDSQSQPVMKSVASTNSDKTCSLDGSTQVPLGGEIRLKLNSNFNLPSDAKIEFSGNNNGLPVSTQTLKVSDLDNFSLALSYTQSTMAGDYRRQMTLISSNGETLCTTNSLSFRYLSASRADQNCISLDGQLEDADSSFSKCSIEEWNLYRKMSARNLVQNHTYSSGIGLPNPAAVNCADIGGTTTTSSNGTSRCSIDKNTLINRIDLTMY